MSPVKITVEQ